MSEDSALSSITIVDNQKGAADTRRQATLSGILATMGGLSITMSLIGKDNIVDPGQWPGSITVICTRNEEQMALKIA